MSVTGAAAAKGCARRAGPERTVALLTAIAGRGFADLAAQAAAVGGDDRMTPKAQVVALAHQYLAFASAHRGMFELMFRHDLLDSGLGLREQSLPLFTVLVDVVARARAVAGLASGATPESVAGALWCNLHGLAELWGWGSLPEGPSCCCKPPSDW
jgi:AcrR family transcriptional regulator